MVVSDQLQAPGSLYPHVKTLSDHEINVVNLNVSLNDRVLTGPCSPNSSHNTEYDIPTCGHTLHRLICACILTGMHNYICIHVFI